MIYNKTGIPVFVKPNKGGSSFGISRVENIDNLIDKLVSAYNQVQIGDPLDINTLMGPLIDQGAVDDYSKAIQAAVDEGGELLCGGKTLNKDGFFVEPTIIRVGSICTCGRFGIDFRLLGALSFGAQVWTYGVRPI